MDRMDEAYRQIEEIVGRETLLSIEKARRLLGYEPAHNHYGRP